MIPAEKPASPAAAPRLLTASRAPHFPVEASVPEHKRHLELRTLLYRVLGTLGGEHTALLGAPIGVPALGCFINDLDA